MAVEPVRACGYRKVGGLYLESDPEAFWTSCDRLPYELTICPACGRGIKYSRTPQRINPAKLFGKHEGTLLSLLEKGATTAICRDKLRPCTMCDPEDTTAFVVWIGRLYYTPQEFITESKTMGVSRRIRTIPQGFKVGETIVFLAHVRAIHTESPDPEVRYKPAIFCITQPKQITQLVWESDLTDAKRAELARRHITPVAVPDGDLDHAPNKGRT